MLDRSYRTYAYNLYRVIGNTVVRCAIDDALRQIEMQTRRGLTLAQCEQVFRAIVQYFDDGKSEGRLGFGSAKVNRLGREVYHG